MTELAEGPNHELFVKVLAQIEREPQKWDQGDWGPTAPACDSAYCFAGWALVISGASELFEEGGDDRVYARFGRLRVHVPQAAADLLGVQYDDYREDTTLELFDGHNDLDDLYRIAAQHLQIEERVLRDKVAAEVAS